MNVEVHMATTKPDPNLNLPARVHGCWRRMWVLRVFFENLSTRRLWRTVFGVDAEVEARGLSRGLHKLANACQICSPGT